MDVAVLIKCCLIVAALNSVHSYVEQRNFQERSKVFCRMYSYLSVARNKKFNLCIFFFFGFVCQFRFGQRLIIFLVPTKLDVKAYYTNI